VLKDNLNFESHTALKNPQIGQLRCPFYVMNFTRRIAAKRRVKRITFGRY